MFDVFSDVLENVGRTIVIKEFDSNGFTIVIFGYRALDGNEIPTYSALFSLAENLMLITPGDTDGSEALRKAQEIRSSWVWLLCYRRLYSTPDYWVVVEWYVVGDGSQAPMGHPSTVFYNNNHDRILVVGRELTADQAEEIVAELRTREEASKRPDAGSH